jgi:VWFA-related protein
VNAAFALVALMAVELAAGEPQQPSASFQSGVDVVRLDVSVVTRNGAPVPGLTASDFIVTDNGARQDVLSVDVDQLPLSVVLVLDISASVSGRRLKRLVAAAKGLLAALRPGDRAGLVTFSHVLRAPTDLTENLAAVRGALDNVASYGRTALHDAVQLGLAKADDVVGRQVMLVFTDGVDNASWLSEEAVVESARRAGIVIHVVRAIGPERSASKLAEQLTEATGGRVWSAASEDDLERLFTRALDEMRARYLLTYSPALPVRPGWHDLKVRLKNGGANVTARRGYFVADR